VAGVYYYLSLRLLFRYIVTIRLLEKLRFGLLDLVRASSSDVSGQHILPTLLVLLQIENETPSEKIK
jgi:hypothetical protein